MKYIAEQFIKDEQVIAVYGYGDGHINDTYRVDTNLGEKRYLLQRINTAIFKNPQELMENIKAVTEYLAAVIEKEGGNPLRETLTVIPTKDKALWYADKEGRVWRMYYFIADGVTLKPEDGDAAMEACGFSFGLFQKRLQDFQASLLHEVLPGFHDTPSRFKQFHTALETGMPERIAECKEEIQLLLAREEQAGCIVKGLQDKTLPLRVTHNDAKLDNILADPISKKGFCVLDLDTIMPGSVLYDFGDAIRSGASTAAEDEADLSLVTISVPAFYAFAKGYVEGADHTLTGKEQEMLYEGAWVIILEQAVRFLGDYLCGDTYYKIAYPAHNLVRAKNQIALLQSLESKKEEIKALCSTLV